jgi:DNA-directed RNA polymerase omega subunit
MPEPDTEDWTTEIDSKYRLVLLAAKRCKQLQRGASRKQPDEEEHAGCA